MFIIWGAMHGAALVVHRAWSKTGCTLPKSIAWLATFMFVNIAWIFFRAHSINDAKNILTAMFSLDSIKSMEVQNVPIINLSMLGINFDYLYKLLPAGIAGYIWEIIVIIVSFIIISQKNSIELVLERKHNYKSVLFISILTSVALCFTIKSTSSVFLYFNF